MSIDYKGVTERRIVGSFKKIDLSSLISPTSVFIGVTPYPNQNCISSAFRLGSQKLAPRRLIDTFTHFAVNLHSEEPLVPGNLANDDVLPGHGRAQCA